MSGLMAMLRTMADPGLIAGVLGIVAAAICLFSLRGHRMRMDLRIEQTREELHIMLRQHQTEYEDGIGQVRHAVEFLEKSGQSTEDALRSRLTRSQRSQAMQLLRSGMSPESAAPAAGMAIRDMRLMAKVSRLLSASGD